MLVNLPEHTVENVEEILSKESQNTQSETVELLWPAGHSLCWFPTAASLFAETEAIRRP